MCACGREGRAFSLPASRALRGIFWDYRSLWQLQEATEVSHHVLMDQAICVVCMHTVCGACSGVCGVLQPCCCMVWGQVLAAAWLWWAGKENSLGLGCT